MTETHKEKSKHAKKESSIAVFCLSSLIRNSKGMISGGWNEDGPFLPVEFARISKNRSLTLVLHPNAAEVQTLWAKTKTTTFKETIIALSKREGTTEDNIGFYSRKDESSRCKIIPKILPKIIEWTKEHELEAVVWTELTSNFKEEMQTLFDAKKKAALNEGSQEEELVGLFDEAETDFNGNNVLSYIADLPAMERNLAREYFFKAPNQIDTSIRRLLRTELGWRSLTEYRDGIWLNNNTFIICDDVQIQLVRRALGNPSGKTEEAPMLILTNAVEMTVDNNGKILGLEKRNKFGLWLDAVNKILKERDIKYSSDNQSLPKNC